MELNFNNSVSVARGNNRGRSRNAAAWPRIPMCQFRGTRLLMLCSAAGSAKISGEVDRSSWRTFNRESSVLERLRTTGLSGRSGRRRLLAANVWEMLLFPLQMIAAGHLFGNSNEDSLRSVSGDGASNLRTPNASRFHLACPVRKLVD